MMYILVPKWSDYNTSGKTELHSLNSFESILAGNFTIFKALIKDRFEVLFHHRKVVSNVKRRTLK